MTTNEIENKNILLNTSMYKIIVDFNVTESFLNVKKFLSLYISFTYTNCISERYFSTIKIIKIRIMIFINTELFPIFWNFEHRCDL